MKRNDLKNSVSILLLLLGLLGITPGLIGQDGEFNVTIQHPSLDTIAYGCPGKIVFLWAGENNSNELFLYDQVNVTWRIGSEEIEQNGQRYEHLFEEGGHYLVELIVTNLKGDTASNIPFIHMFISMPPYFTGTRSDHTSICSGEEITLTGFVASNPWTEDEYPFENEYNQSGYEWSGAMMVSDRNGIGRAQPPLDEGHQKYIFRVEDDFGCYHDTTLQIYGLYAEYTFEPENGEAPLEVEFIPDKVDNGGAESEVDYLWEAHERTGLEDPLSTMENVMTFERPGEYSTWMTASYDQCSYKFEVTDVLVRVDSSLVEVPNIFTPNEDGLNDFFQVKSASLKSFHGKVFNRWGRLVYEWTDWTTQEAGWNGRNQNDGSPAPAGTYFYVIEASGWDWDYGTSDYKKYTDRKVDKELRQYTGFVTLMR